MTGLGGRGPVDGERGLAPPEPRAPSPDILLLYDGTCGFCAASVQWVLRRDRQGTLMFAPLQGETARPILARHPELAGVDSVMWVEDPGGAGERVFVKSAVAAQVGRYLGGLYRINAWTDPLLPRRFRDWVYDLVARHRHRIIPWDPACLLPSAEERGRFLP